jgi:hypothetical protein
MKDWWKKVVEYLSERIVTAYLNKRLVQTIDLNPDSIVVLYIKHPLTKEENERAIRWGEIMFPGKKFIILDEETKLSIIQPKKA